MLNVQSSIFGLTICTAVLIGPAAGPVALQQGPQAAPLVITLHLDDEAITPITSRFLIGTIEDAEKRQAACLVIVLDTPGGLLDATRDVVKAILDARVPIAVFVPTGGRAASAGVFVTLASHVAGMAPASTIGAAHPVQIGGLPIAPPPAKKTERQPGEEAPESRGQHMLEKIVNDTTAWARSLAGLRGRSTTWAENAVKNSIVATGEEAVAEGVVEYVCADLDEFLRALTGHEVSLPQGAVRLSTAGCRMETAEMWWGERVLAVVCNPNVAFLLLMIGIYGLLFELYSPGWGVAGTVGIVCLLLGCLALSLLPINYVGLALIVVAIGMFVAEVFVVSFGFLTVGGIACLILGGLLLVDSPLGFMRISLSVVVPVAVGTAFVMIFLISNVVRAHRRAAQTGDETLMSAEAAAAEDFTRTRSAYQARRFAGSHEAGHGQAGRERARAPCQGDPR